MTYVLSNLPFDRTFYKFDMRHNLLTENTLKKITEDLCAGEMFRYCGQTFSRFGWTMSDDRLLFPALQYNI